MSYTVYLERFMYKIGKIRDRKQKRSPPREEAKKLPFSARKNLILS
jgi:hypothetical protein